jgi:hypothetical protein
MSYKIDEIMAAMGPFENRKGANKRFEKRLRKKESVTRKIKAGEVTIISNNTFQDCLSENVAAHCLGKVFSAVMEKFNELGFKAIEEE